MSMTPASICARPGCGHHSAQHTTLVGCLEDECPCEGFVRNRARDTEEGRELGHAGARDAEASHAMTVSPEGREWRTKAEARLEELIQAGEPFTADDVTETCGVAPSPSAIGGLFLSRKKDMTTVGYRESTRPVAHARPLRVWQAKA